MGREVVFNVSTNILYYHDTVDRVIVIINMVAKNREGFTSWVDEGANAARRDLVIMGYPSDQ